MKLVPLFAGVLVLLASCPACAQEKTAAAPTSAPAAPEIDPNAAPDASGLTRISKTDAVWVDLKRKLVVVDGEIAFREGFLEMFACPQGTKEHESLVAVYSKAFVVHTALLAVGAIPGRPVQFNPDYRAAEGPIVEIHVLWRDAEGKKHKVRAQEWIRNTKTEKTMEQNWVFGGSGFWKDEETGKQHYYAEEGDLICVSNFGTAMLDVPVESTQSDGQLLFETFTERVPPKGTKVRLVLIPRVEKKPAAEPVPQPKPATEAKPKTTAAF